VKLTWDEDDPERSRITRKKLTQKEIEDGDFRNYIASSSDEEEADKSKTKNRDTLRALLLGGRNQLPEGWAQPDDAEDSDIDMEITFTPGLDTSTDNREETTLENYQRKQRERRKQRKEEKERRETTVQKHDDFFDVSDDGDASAYRKISPQASEAMPNNDEAEFCLEYDESRHFNMKDVMKAEKAEKRNIKNRRSKISAEEPQLQEHFRIDTSDDRFQALFEDHNYAIDPSNPQYVVTLLVWALMTDLLFQLQENGFHGCALGRTHKKAQCIEQPTF
jgi:hypothetical protein